MAEGSTKPSGGLDPWLLIFLVLAVAVLFNRGGSSGGSSGDVRYGSPSKSGTVEEDIRARERSNFFFNPSPNPTPTPAQTPPSSQNTTILRPSKTNLSMQSFGSPKLVYAEEYIQLSAPSSNKGKVNVSGIVLKNKNNESVTVGTDEFGGAILLGPGERAIISSIPSPRGFNFKINKCSGYLAQNRKYYPSINSFCPHISTLNQVSDMNEKCIKYIKSLNYCTTPIVNFQTGIDNQCSTFISQHASYPGCVADFKNDSDFDRKEWRVYLGLTKEFWSNSKETIRVFDTSRELIFETSY